MSNGSVTRLSPRNRLAAARPAVGAGARTPRSRTFALGTALAAGLCLATASLAAAQSEAPSAARVAVEAQATPRTAMRGYLEACRDGDYERAARFLELEGLPPDERRRGPELAREFKIVLDRTLWVDLEALSEAPEGDPEDGLPAQRDRVGTIERPAGDVEVWLDRVPGPGSARVWKISSATLARVPALYEEFGYGKLGRWLPDPFFEIRVLEIELWQWVGLAIAIVLAWSFSWLVVHGLLRIVRPLIARTATTFDDHLLDITIGPLRLLVAIGIFAVGMLSLSLTVPAQQFFLTVEKILLFGAVVWLLSRLIDVFSAWTSSRLLESGQIAIHTMLPLGRRIAKAVLGVLAVLALLQSFGFNVTTLLAGLGVGGLAVALAAQRTFENLFGGIAVIADQPVRVGDFCRFGDKLGVVEDIGLRSTRLRTLDRTVVSVPNAEFAQIQLENFAKRDQIWYHPRIGVRYETTPDQLRYILVEIRKMLYAHPRVDPDPARIRFAGFGAYSLDLDIFAYVQATDYGEYLEIAEDLNLRIMDIVERAGTGFAFPSQTLYVGKDDGLNGERARAAESEVEAWRKERRLFLPQFPPEEIERLAASLDYPPEGSPLRPSP